MNRPSQRFIRMSGADQMFWNLVNDMDLFSIWGIASLTEPLEDALIEQSLQCLLRTVPILNARPVTTWFSGKWQFLAKENVADLITRVRTADAAKTEEQLQEIFNTPVPAEDGAMIRLHSVDGPNRHYFVIQVHHVVMDGEGVKRVCEQFAAIYRALHRNPNLEPQEILDGTDACRSIRQILRQASPIRFSAAIPAYFRNLSRKAPALLRHKKRQGCRVLNTVKRESDPSLRPYFTDIRFEKELLLAAKSFSKQRKTTVHALLMTSFSLAILEWNRERGDKRDWLRFFHTANLRRWWGEPTGTFCNFSVVLRYEESAEKLGSPSLALAAAQAQLELEKKHIGLDAFFISALLAILPYFLVRRLTLRLKEKIARFAHRNQAMTNIGIIPEQTGDFGHAKAEGYSLLAPTVPGGCLLFTVSTYKNVMTVSLGCTEDGLSKEDARNFLQLWKAKFLRVIAE